MKIKKQVLLVGILVLSFALICVGALAFFSDSSYTSQSISIGSLNFDLGTSLLQHDVNGNSVKNVSLSRGTNDPDSSENTPDIELTIDYTNTGNVSLITRTIVNISGKDKDGTALTSEELRDVLIGQNAQATGIGDTISGTAKKNITLLDGVANGDNTVQYILGGTDEAPNVLSGVSKDSADAQIEYDSNGNPYATSSSTVYEVGLKQNPTMPRSSIITIEVNFQAIQYKNTGDDSWKTVFTKTYTLDAEWLHNITLIYDNGTDTETIRTIDASDLPTPSKTGYTFDGWYVYDENTGITDTLRPDEFTEDVTLMAKWTAIKYSITLDDGTKLEYTVESDPITLPEPTKPGYTFDGWYEDPDFSGDKITTVDPEDAANKDYYAKWTPITYSIIYNLNGGSNPSGAVSTYTIESNDITLPTPTRNGYTFDGWFTTSDLSGSKVTSIPTGSTGNKTFYAKWTAIKYSITLDDGTKLEYTVESDPITLPTPTKPGYTFDGWYEDPDFSGDKITTVDPEDAANKDYYAKWTPITYSIIYNLNGGSNPSGAVSTYTIESNDITLPTPTRNGYTFDGWFTTSDLSGSKVTSIPTGSTGNKTFYAKWTAIKYSITLDDGTKLEYTVESDPITLPTPTKPGYTFDGWYEDPDFSGDKITTVDPEDAANKDYYAKWTPITYSIIYNLNGGSNPTGAVSTYNIESSDITLPTPTRNGYTFEGWFTASDFSGNKVTSIPTGSTGNKTFYAKWTANSYTYNIVYKSSSGAQLGTATATYNYGTTNSIRPKSFTGYTSPASQNIAWDSTTAKTITFTYTPIKYTVVYNSNGGSGTMANSSHTYDLAATLSVNTFTKTDYEFVGWSTTSGESNVVYKDGESVKNLISTNGDSITLYAQWRLPVDYAIYSVDDKSLIFYNNADTVAVGDTYNGRTVTALYTNVEDIEAGSSNYTTNIPWYNYRTAITSISFVDEIKPIDLSYWFSGFTQITTIDFTNLNTSNTLYMNRVFDKCSKLTSLDLSTWDTRNVKQMAYMFNECSSLKSLNISTFNTTNVNHMGGMFYGCKVLTSIDLSSFDTRNVTLMWSMFRTCYALTEIKFSEKFNTSNVTDMSQMFRLCEALTTINFPSSFNTSNVTDMEKMLYQCPNLVVNCSSWNVNKVTSYSGFNSLSPGVTPPNWVN